jgi:hypothetical protein
MGIGSFIGKILGGGEKKQKQSQNERDLAIVSAKEMNHYLDNYRSAEHQLIAQIKTSAGDRANAKGAAASQARQMSAGLSQGTAVANLAAGAEFTSGRSVLQSAGVHQATASAAAQGSYGIDNEADVQDLKGSMKIAAFGRDMADNSRLGLEQGATRTSKAAYASLQAKMMERQAIWNAAGTVAGAVLASGKFNKKPKEPWKRDSKAEYGTLANPNYYDSNYGKYDSVKPTNTKGMA